MQWCGFSTLHYVSLQETCTTSYALGKKCTDKLKSKGNNLKKMTRNAYKVNQRGITRKLNKVELWFLVHIPSSHCKKYSYQVWSHLNIWWKCENPTKKCSIKTNFRVLLKLDQGKITAIVHCSFSHCKKYAYQVWSHFNLWWQSYTPDKNAL